MNQLIENNPSTGKKVSPLNSVATRLVNWLWNSKLFDLIVKKWVLGTLPPEIQLRLAILTGSSLDPDLGFLQNLCSAEKVSVDVGAHFGLYSYYMAKYSSCVYSFEPMARYAKALRRANFPGRVIVDASALSNTTGKRTLRTPAKNHTMATLEEKNLLVSALPHAQILEECVKVKRLDDCNIIGIGFIKIDAEGHELEVLQGACETLDRDSPTLLLELVDYQRPNTIQEVNQFLTLRGYKGFSLQNNRLFPIENFDPLLFQKLDNVSSYGRRGEFFSNFVFIKMGQISSVENYLTH